MGVAPRGIALAALEPELVVIGDVGEPVTPPEPVGGDVGVLPPPPPPALDMGVLGGAGG